jgi:hypothetical protein
MAWYQDPNSSQIDASHGDVPTVSAFVPIVATAASRPLRRLAQILVVTGIAFSLLSFAGAITWIVVVSGAVDYAQKDIRDANEQKDDKIFFDLDTEAGNIELVLELAGVGVAMVGVALGVVIVVIGGVARQLDRTLAPVGETHTSGVVAAVAYPA